MDSGIQQYQQGDTHASDGQNTMAMPFTAFFLIPQQQCGKRTDSHTADVSPVVHLGYEHAKQYDAHRPTANLFIDGLAKGTPRLLP